MQDFCSTLLHCDLADLGYQGYKYTWRNNRPENTFVEKGLDRAYANLKWREMFLAAKVRHLTASYSDHDPILLETVIAQLRHWGRRIQLFEEKWVAHVECEDQIRRSWTQSYPVGSPMFCLFEKIKNCRMNLRRWSRDAFGNTRDHLNAKQQELQQMVNSNYRSNVERIN